MALSLAIPMDRLWRGVPGGWTPGRLRQLGSSPIVSIACDPEDAALPTLPLLLRIPLLDVVLRTGS